MNGAHSLVKTLLNNGVDTVFANPGTSEMHFVGALDEHPEMNCVLCLFEGGTTGAACLLYTSPSPRDLSTSRMPSSA